MNSSLSKVKSLLLGELKTLEDQYCEIWEETGENFISKNLFHEKTDDKTR